jgi:hypothetical protein
MGADKFLIPRFLEVKAELHIPHPQTPMSRKFALEYSVRSTVEEGQVGLKLNARHWLPVCVYTNNRSTLVLIIY